MIKKSLLSLLVFSTLVSYSPVLANPGAGNGGDANGRPGVGQGNGGPGDGNGPGNGAGQGQGGQGGNGGNGGAGGNGGQGGNGGNGGNSNSVANNANKNNNSNSNTNNNTANGLGIGIGGRGGSSKSSSTSSSNATGGNATQSQSSSVTFGKGSFINNNTSLYYPDWMNVAPNTSSFSYNSVQCQGATLNGAVSTLTTDPWNSSYGVQGTVGVSVPLSGQSECYAVQKRMREQIDFKAKAEQVLMCKQLENSGIDLKAHQEFSACLVTGKK